MRRPRARDGRSAAGTRIDRPATASRTTGRSSRRTCGCSSPAANPTAPAREMLNRYLLDQARQQFDARRKAIAAIKTPEDIAERQTGAAGVLPPVARRPARADAAEPARRRDAPARRLPRREGHLREPAGAPRHGQSLPARRQAAVPRRAARPAGTATTARPTSSISGRRSCWPRTAWPCSATTRSARASGFSARRAGQAGDPRHDRAHHGRHRGAPGRPAGGQLPDLGRLAGARLPGEPARGRSPTAWAAPATRAAAR